MGKYLVVKFNPATGQTYTVWLKTDKELVEHIRGTIENTDHGIISIVNTVK